MALYDFTDTINDACNVRAIILLLHQKGIVSIDEFNKAKDQAIKDFKKEYPENFKGSE
jgi:hypothetical protein